MTKANAVAELLGGPGDGLRMVFENQGEVMWPESFTIGRAMTGTGNGTMTYEMDSNGHFDGDTYVVVYRPAIRA